MKHDRIEVNPDVMLGKPVIKGTRLTVQHVIDELNGGVSEQDLLTAHPRLTLEDIAASRAFAAEYMTIAAQ